MHVAESFFQRIGKSGIFYIFIKGGYIRKIVAIGIAYAYSKNKHIIASESLDELYAQTLVSKTKKPKELVVYCKNN